MKLEKFKEKNNKKKLTIGISIVLVLLVAGIMVYRSFAFYEERKAFDVIKGQVPDQNYDLMLSFYIKDENDNLIYQETMPEGKEYTVTMECNNGATGEWDYNNWNIKNLNVTTSRTKCKLIFKNGYILGKKGEVGQYISYTPSVTSYTPDATLVGGTDFLFPINPSELNLWRIIRKNEDGSIEAVSEYASSQSVNLYGQTGYANLVGVLNLTAKQYEDEKYTIGSRHMGYYNQEEFNSMQETTQYTIDTGLVQSACGTLIANKVGTDSASTYWIADRESIPRPDIGATYYNVIYVSTSGEAAAVIGEWFYSTTLEYGVYWKGTSIRPIVIFKPTVEVTGNGTKSNPWKVN